MISFDEAFDLVRDHVRPTAIRRRTLGSAAGLRLAEDVRSEVDLPIFDNSAVDGYAIHEADLTGGLLTLGGEIRAGSVSQRALRPGECFRVLTGAAIPPGAAAVVMQEDVVLEGASLLFPEARPGANIRRQGEELRKGEVILPLGSRLNPAAIGALAASGVTEVDVFRKPKVAILVTGDELTPPGEPLIPGRIYESNSFALKAALGSETIAVRVPDERNAIRETVAQLMSENDVILTSGGVSVGQYDLVRPVLAELGVEEVFWRVAIKPAKPTYFGVHEETAFFGLPGNPVSTLVAFSLFVRPYLIAAQGGPFGLEVETRTLASEVMKSAGREEFVPGQSRGISVEPILGRASHKLTCLATADCLIRIAAETTRVEKGDTVQVIPLRWD